MKSLFRPLSLALLLGSLSLISYGSAPGLSDSGISPQAQVISARSLVYGGYMVAKDVNDSKTVTHTISKIVVSNATTGANGTATYTITFSPAETFTVGQSVTISGLTGNFALLNNIAPVLKDNLTDTTFSITESDVFGSVNSFAFGVRYQTIANGTYDTTGTDNFGTNGAVAVSSAAPSANPRDPTT